MPPPGFEDDEPEDCPVCPVCLRCNSHVHIEVTRMSKSIQRIETIAIKAIEALSLDVDLGDLQQPDNNQHAEYEEADWDPQPEGDFWSIMGPGAPNNHMGRLWDEFRDFVADEAGRFRHKDGESRVSVLQRWLWHSRDDRLDELWENGDMGDTDQRVLVMIQGLWPEHGIQFGTIAELGDFVRELCPGVDVHAVNYTDEGYPGCAWESDTAFGLFCNVCFDKPPRGSCTFWNIISAVMACTVTAKWNNTRPVLDFIQAFLDWWPSRTLARKLEWKASDPFWESALVISLRTLSRNHGPPNCSRPSEEATAFPPCRRKGTLGNILIGEVRWSAILYTTKFRKEPFFTIIAFADKRYKAPFDIWQAKKMWPRHRLSPAGCHAGVISFQWVVMNLLNDWASEWEDFLDLLDETSDAQTGDILSSAGRREAMFDNEKFEMSENYFATSQLLRVASNWVKYTSMDFQTLLRSYHDNYETEVTQYYRSKDCTQCKQLKIVAENWMVVGSHFEIHCKYLLERIQGKEAEIDSLRNGLFNATSIAEAQRSSQLSHYILIFTIVTIFYLPLGFITSLFALGLFDFDQPSETSIFIASIAITAAATYVVSFTLAWVVKKEERRQMFKNLLPWPNHHRGSRQVDDRKVGKRNNTGSSINYLNHKLKGQMRGPPATSTGKPSAQSSQRRKMAKYRKRIVGWLPTSETEQMDVQMSSVTGS